MPSLPHFLERYGRACVVLAVLLLMPPRWVLAQEPTAPSAPADPYAAPFAERVLVSFTAASGETARSVVLVRFDPGSPGEPIAPNATPNATPVPLAAPRLRLTLSRLEVLVTPGKLLASYRGDPSNYFEAPLPDPLTLDALRAALPPLPIPQLQWCLGDPTQRTSMHPFGLATTLLSSDLDGTRHYSAAGASLSVAFSPRSGRPRHIELHASDSSILQLDITPASVGDPASWDLPIENRHRVPTLAELRRAAESTLVGKPLRDIGFTRPDLTPISLTDMLQDAPPTSVPEPPHAARSALLLVFEAGRDGLPLPGIVADLAATRAVIYAALTASDTPAASRVQPRLFLIRGLPLETLDIPAIAPSARTLLEGTPPSVDAMVLNTAASDWILKDQMGGCQAAVLLLNSDRVVTCALPLDGRTENAEAFADELRTAITALGPVNPVK